MSEVQPSPVKTPARRLLGALLVAATILGGLLLDALAAPLIAFGAECITRGYEPALAWVDAEKTPAPFIAGSVLLFLCIRALHAIFPRALAIGIVGAATGLVAYAGVIKMDKLGAPLSASDLLLVDQLMPTAGMLWGPWIPPIVAGACTVAVIAVIVTQLRRRARGAAWTRVVRGFDVLCGLLALALVFVPDYSGGTPGSYKAVIPQKLSTYGIDNYRFAPLINVDRNGQLLVFLFEMRGIVLDRGATLVPPTGYDKEAIDAIVAKPAPPAPAPAASSRMPIDVVVIQSEAWWNPAQLPGVHFDDPMFDALESTAHGTLYSPTFGGYTVNAEFEVLTRLSTAFLTPGSIPYQQFVHRSLPSLVDDFGAAGYDTIALHPYLGTFWNRNVVYPRLGFRRFLTQDDFVKPELVFPYISDMAMAKKIIETLDAAPSERKFVYVVSMQNHAPYANLAARYDGFTRVGVKGDKLDASASDTLSTYASGARDAVRSFNTIVDHLRTSGRPALVVMFGDHLPYLGDSYDPYFRTGFISANTMPKWTTADFRRMHGVPVVAWSNLPQGVSFPAQQQSLVFLGTSIKRAAGLPMSPMDDLLARVALEQGVLTHEGPDGRALEAKKGKGAIAEYHLLEYDLLSGRGYAACTLRPSLCAAGGATKKAASK